MAIAAGSRLGPYEIVSPLGAGGMGEVYRATDTRLGRDVAIKVLPASFAYDPERLARFEREARTLASLNHPHIAAIYGVEESGDTRALVMEFVDGPTLADRVVPGPMRWDEAQPIARQIADALAAAHEQGIVHRDLKPANIKVRHDGTVKVLDFGLAKALDTTETATARSMAATITSPAMTQAGIILGTAAYMAPEQARGKPLDRRADIWAFGCVLYEMLTGRRAFAAEDVSLTLSMVLQREPDFSSIPPGTPAAVRQTLRVCLRKDARERASDIRDVRLALDGAFAVEAPAAAAAVPPAARIRGALAWSLAAVAMLAAAVSGYGWWRSTRPVDRPLTRLSVDLGPSALRGSRGALAMSPDGTRIVFVGRGSDTPRQLFMQQLDQATAAPIAGTGGGLALSAPFFSPDGSWIAFFDASILKKVPTQGGPVSQVTDAGTTILGASWGDDGNIYMASQNGLLRAPSAGGAPELLKGSNQSGGGFRTVKFFAHVLPGSRAIVHSAGTAIGADTLDDMRIEVFDIADGKTKTLVTAGYDPHFLPTSARSGHLVYVSNGTLFGVGLDTDRLELIGAPSPLLDGIGNPDLLTGSADYAFSRTGTFVFFPGSRNERSFQIGWMDAAGTFAPLLPQPGTYGAPRVSPDGSRVAYGLGGGKGGDLWIHDLARNTSTQLTFTGPGLRELAWAPDSKHLVFGDGVSLWWTSADGAGEPQKILDKADNPRPFSIRADGRLVFCVFGVQGLPDVFTLPLDLSDPQRPKPGAPEPFAATRAVEVDPTFSPDGRFIAYASNELGMNDVYVRPFPGPGGKWKISTGGGKFPVWSAASHELLFLGGDDRIQVVNYTTNGDSFTATTPRAWSQTPVLRDGVRQSFDISPDGKRVVMFPRGTQTAVPQTTLHANFLLNFFDEVRRKIPAR